MFEMKALNCIEVAFELLQLYIFTPSFRRQTKVSEDVLREIKTLRPDLCKFQQLDFVSEQA